MSLSVSHPPDPLAEAKLGRRAAPRQSVLRRRRLAGQGVVEDRRGDIAEDIAHLGPLGHGLELGNLQLRERPRIARI